MEVWSVVPVELVVIITTMAEILQQEMAVVVVLVYTFLIQRPLLTLAPSPGGTAVLEG